MYQATNSALMIPLRSPNERQFSVTICFVFLIIIHFELFIFLSESQNKHDEGCDNVISVVYTDSNSTPNLVALLLDKWKSSPENLFTILSVPRKTKGNISIVIPFVEHEDNSNFRNLLDTITSISNQTKESEKLVNNLVVLFHSIFKYHGVVQKILENFSLDVQIGFLQLIKVPSLHNTSILYAQQYFMSDVAKNVEKCDTCRFLDMVSTCFPHLAIQASYVWYMNSDVEILNEKFLTKAFNFVKKMTKPWSIIDFSDHLSGVFTGKLIRVEDVNKFAFFFIHLVSQRYFKETEKTLYTAHLDYLHLMYQANFITFRPTLMVRRSQVFQQDGKVKWRSNDPSGMIITNMHPRDFQHGPMRAYGSLPNQYFEAISPQYGQWFAIVFDEEVYLDKVVLELEYQNVTYKTGNISVKNLEKSSFKSSLDNNMESIVNGILEASPKMLKLDVQRNVLTCADYILIRDVYDKTTIAENLQDKLFGRPTRCLKFTFASYSPPQTLQIKQLAVFSSDY